jgi:hypothetical protein
MPSWRRTGVSARSGSLEVQIDWDGKARQAVSGEVGLAVLHTYQKVGDSRQSESEPNSQLKNVRYR